MHGVRASRGLYRCMRTISRVLVEDGFVPARCIRGWTFYADFALIDRRRARRIARRVREFALKRRRRNESIRSKHKRY